MTVANLSEMDMGDLLVRRSAYTDIPVVVVKIENGILSVTLRPEEQLLNVETMTIGMMHLGAEGSPVQLVKGVRWDYDIATGIELNPSSLGQSILLKYDE